MKCVYASGPVALDAVRGPAPAETRQTNSKLFSCTVLLVVVHFRSHATAASGLALLLVLLCCHSGTNREMLLPGACNAVRLYRLGLRWRPNAFLRWETSRIKPPNQRANFGIVVGRNNWPLQLESAAPFEPPIRRAPSPNDLLLAKLLLARPAMLYELVLGTDEASQLRRSPILRRTWLAYLLLLRNWRIRSGAQM